MIGMAAALILATATDLTVRMRDSAVAAQALQGALDGTWTLRDLRQQPLFVFQITDPVDGAGLLEGAWRRAGASGSSGFIDSMMRRGSRLEISFVCDGDIVHLRLRDRGEGAWSGRADEKGQAFPVALERYPRRPGTLVEKETHGRR